jgi:thioredoxin 1
VLDKETFDHTVKDSDNPVIVDFYADWCQPCKLIARVLEEIAEENKESFSVYKVDTEKDPELAMEYNVTALPTLISFKEGKEFKRIRGVAPKDELVNLVN